MKRSAPSLVLAMLLAFNLRATNPTFRFTETCTTAYRHCLSLRLAQAEALLRDEQKAGNLCASYLSNYIDFFSLLASENVSHYEQIRSHEDELLRQLENIPRTSPWHRFAKAEVMLQWAVMHIRFGYYTDGILNLRKAYLLAEKNHELFPDFLPNKKTMGVLQILIGSVPDSFQWAMRLLGMRGNLNEGILLLKQVAENNRTDNLFREESELMFALLMMNLGNQKEEAWQYLKQHGHPLANHLLSSYAMAFLGVYARHTDDAIRIIASRPQTRDYCDFPLFHYLMGIAKTNSLDAGAPQHLQQFIREYKGKNNIRAAWQKLAWCSFLNGDTAAYRRQMEQLLLTGSETVDADKQASHEARSNTLPNAALLRARVLCDGGYFHRALHEITPINEASLNPSELTEWLYRNGKIHTGLNNRDKALDYFQKATRAGKNLPRYFAASAAYEAGFIFETKGDREAARQYYMLCLSSPDHEYKNSLDQKARAGLQRIEK